MVRQLPRNHKSKGLKLKHVLQACVLLGICFWLVYQIKHSRDKMDFHTNDAKVSSTDGHAIHTLKLGRKGMDPRIERTSVKNAKLEQEDEMEKIVKDEKGGVEGDVEGDEEAVIKHDKSEEEEFEGETVKVEKIRGEGEEEIEIEDDSKREEGGNDENGEIDEEKTVDIDDAVLHDEDVIVDENLKVNMGDNYDDDTDPESVREASNRTTREAREEQYNGDDASSAVLDSPEPENNTFSSDPKLFNSTLIMSSEPKNAGDGANSSRSEEILKSGSSNGTRNSSIAGAETNFEKMNQTQSINAGNESSTVLGYSNGENQRGSGLSSASEISRDFQQDDQTGSSDSSILGEENELLEIINGTHREDAAAL